MLRAEAVGDKSEHAEWKTVLIDSRNGQPVVPNGTIGDRWGEEGEGKWNLDLGDVEPELTLLGSHDELVEVTPDAVRVRKRILDCNRRPRRDDEREE